MEAVEADFGILGESPNSGSEHSLLDHMDLVYEQVEELGSAYQMDAGLDFDYLLGAPIYCSGCSSPGNWYTLKLEAARKVGDCLRAWSCLARGKTEASDP